MKKGTHPEYTSATIVCSCGNEFETRSTQDEIHVEICAVCHPFYTGRQKLVDTAGRVERFKRKYGDVSSGASEEEGAEDEAAREQEVEAAEADAGDRAVDVDEMEADQPGKIEAAAEEEASADEGGEDAEANREA